MTSYKKCISNKMPLIFIDVGSDNVKFTQPVINSFSISNLLREVEDKKWKKNKNK